MVCSGVASGREPHRRRRASHQPLDLEPLHEVHQRHRRARALAADDLVQPGRGVGAQRIGTGLDHRDAGAGRPGLRQRRDEVDDQRRRRRAHRGQRERAVGPGEQHVVAGGEAAGRRRRAAVARAVEHQPRLPRRSPRPASRACAAVRAPAITARVDGRALDRPGAVARSRSGTAGGTSRPGPPAASSMKLMPARATSSTITAIVARARCCCSAAAGSASKAARTPVDIRASAARPRLVSASATSSSTSVKPVVPGSRGRERRRIACGRVMATAPSAPASRRRRRDGRRAPVPARDRADREDRGRRRAARHRRGVPAQGVGGGRTAQRLASPSRYSTQPATSLNRQAGLEPATPRAASSVSPPRQAAPRRCAAARATTAGRLQRQPGQRDDAAGDDAERDNRFHHREPAVPARRRCPPGLPAVARRHDTSGARRDPRSAARRSTRLPDPRSARRRATPASGATATAARRRRDGG